MTKALLGYIENQGKEQQIFFIQFLKKGNLE